MSFFSLLHGIPGVRRAVFRDAEGALLEGMGGITADTENITTLSTAIAFSLSQLGQVLDFGPCELVVVRTDKLAKVLVLRRGALAVLDVDPKRLTTDLEKKLRTTDWSAKGIDAAAATRPRFPTPAPHVPLPKKASLGLRPPTAEAVSADGGKDQPRARPALPMSPEIPAADDSKERPKGKEASVSPPPAAPAEEVKDPPKKEETPTLAEAPGIPTTKVPTPLSSEIVVEVKDPPSAASGSSPGRRLRKLKITASAAAVGGNDKMFGGSLRMVSLPDLLEFCRNGHRTGVLFCHLGETDGSVRLRQGRIMEAESPKTSSMTLLGQLLESGDASEEQARDLGLENDDGTDDETVAKLLIDAGFTDPEAIRKVKMAQIHASIEEMIEWTDGTFAFHPMEEEPLVGDDAGIDPEVVLLQIFKEKDERERDKNPG
jgi:hypothetical protein